MPDSGAHTRQSFLAWMVVVVINLTATRVLILPLPSRPEGPQQDPLHGLVSVHQAVRRPSACFLRLKVLLARRDQRCNWSLTAQGRVRQIVTAPEVPTAQSQVNRFLAHRHENSPDAYSTMCCVLKCYPEGYFLSICNSNEGILENSVSIF